MTWFKVDDSFHSHPKAMATDPAALGLWVVAGSWCSSNLTDGFVPDHVLPRLLPGAPKLARKLIAAELWVRTERGYLFHDWRSFNPTAEQVKAERAGNTRRAALHRDPELVEAIRLRDRGRCRYCGQLVNWKDRRSGSGGTYDHVDPTGPNSLDNVVIACRACNNAKGCRTPEQARMVLLPPGDMGGPPSGGHDPPLESSTYLERNQKSSSYVTRTFLDPDPTRPDPNPSSGYVGMGVQGGGGAENEPPRKRGSPRDGCRIPDDFAVTPGMVTWARDNTPHVDGHRETAAFVDHWRSKTGRDATKRDWPATWRNWMRKAESWSTSRNCAAGQRPGTDENIRRILAGTGTEPSNVIALPGGTAWLE